MKFKAKIQERKKYGKAGEVPKTSQLYIFVSIPKGKGWKKGDQIEGELIDKRS